MKMNMGKKCADTQIAHAIAIHAKIAVLALALMAFQANLTNEGETQIFARACSGHGALSGNKKGQMDYD